MKCDKKKGPSLLVTHHICFLQFKNILYFFQNRKKLWLRLKKRGETQWVANGVKNKQKPAANVFHQNCLPVVRIIK